MKNIVLISSLLFVFFHSIHAGNTVVTLGLKFHDNSEISSETITSIASVPILNCEPVFKRAVTQLLEDRNMLVSRGYQAPDLTRCFYLQIAKEHAPKILQNFQSHPMVEFIYIVPEKLVPASIQDFPTDDSPDFTEYQEYLFDPQGPHLARAWDYELGTGAGVTVVDIEANCNRNHEDLTWCLGREDAVIGGSPGGTEKDRNHGTAVAGLLIAENNGFGVTGICHEAVLRLHFVTEMTMLPDAIDTSQAAINPGDIILIEMQTTGPNWPGVEPQDGMVPVEWDNMTRLAIANAVALGRVIIQPAGNGRENLDDPVYDAVFGAGSTNTGSIIVGAGRPADRTAVNYSNYGSRVDLQGWAERINPCCQVWSTGYGNAPGSSMQTNKYYTHKFSGTSSASAMVAGAAVCLQSAGKYRKANYLTPAEIRSILVSTGDPWTGDYPIGPLPNIAAAIESIPIAQISIDLDLNQPMFAPHDPFVLSEHTSNPRSPIMVSRYLALQCMDDWFFMDCNGRWVSYVTGCPDVLSPGTYDATYLDFIWPDGNFGEVNPGSGFAIYLAYFTLMGDFELIGNYDSVSFGWTYQ